MTLMNYLNKKKYFEFYIINITNTDENYQELINVFSNIIVNPYIINENQYTIIISFVINNEIGQVINTLVDDFGKEMKIFKSNKIYVENMENFTILKNLFYKYIDYINENYISINVLVQTIMEHNINDLDIIKPVIIDNIKREPKLFEIANAMFINDLNVCKTASYVYMHRNTINNKLVVIKEETGLDIQKFQEAVILYVLFKK